MKKMGYIRPPAFVPDDQTARRLFGVEEEAQGQSLRNSAALGRGEFVSLDDMPPGFVLRRVADEEAEKYFGNEPWIASYHALDGPFVQEGASGKTPAEAVERLRAKLKGYA